VHPQAAVDALRSRWLHDHARVATDASEATSRKRTEQLVQMKMPRLVLAQRGTGRRGRGEQPRASGFHGTARTAAGAVGAGEVAGLCLELDLQALAQGYLLALHLRGRGHNRGAHEYEGV